MAKVSINKLKPGMTIDGDVKDITGRLLLGSGTVISEKHIHVFKAWGVIEVAIQGIEEEAVETENGGHVDPEAIRKAEEALSELFRHTDLSSPVIKELFRLCVQHEVHTMHQGSEHHES